MGNDIVLTFAAAMAAALILGYLAHRLGLSPVVGFLLAGIAVGPHTPGFTANLQVAEQFSEMGIILLMFGVGLKFHLHELFAVWRISVPGALLTSLLTTLLAWAGLSAIDIPSDEALVAGLAISVASTVVLMRVLAENRDLSTRAGHIAVGWVVVEDLFTV
ncbi:MAG: sodium:proton exchanger, partial [Verrucomicrobia bacterium]|nr:sodium:proton exchanger [Verrucomicrobiota bacterium]